MSVRVKVDRDRFLIAGFTLSRTRIKGLTRSSGFQKLENSNLEILKFEARFAYAVKF